MVIIIMSIIGISMVICISLVSVVMLFVLLDIE